jgi:hypothetical protein
MRCFFCENAGETCCYVKIVVDQSRDMSLIQRFIHSPSPNVGQLEVSEDIAGGQQNVKPVHTWEPGAAHLEEAGT